MQQQKGRVKHNRGFTLIELMVVVCILGILGGVMVPVILKVVSLRKKQLKSARKAVAQKSVQIQSLKKTKNGFKISRKKLPSSLVSSDVKVNLKVTYLLEDGHVIPVYQAEFEANYVLRNPLDKPLFTIIHFPFPQGAGTFSDLKFLTSRQPPQFDGPHKPSRSTSQPVQKAVKKGVSKLEPPRSGANVTPRGVYWKRRFVPKEEVRVQIVYKVRGRDHYRYLISPGKKRRFHFSLSVSGVDPEVPSDTLQPTSVKRHLDAQKIVNQYNWRFTNFLSTEHIEVRFPPQYSKYYRFALLGKLGVISLLFFALFFWYFGEKQNMEQLKSGRKTQVNMGLLFLGFISFFPLFIFLEDHISISKAIPIALVTSTILSTGHVATFMGLRWAILVSFPLQFFFTAGFTFAVLVPTYRPLAFTIGAIILVAFIIIAHARYQKEKEKKEAEEAAILADWEAQQAALEDKQKPRKTEIQNQKETTLPNKQPTEPRKPKEETQHCLFCNTQVDPSFKHCNNCGKNLKRTHNCGTCNEEYWYPSVQDFSYCRRCGSHLSAPSLSSKAT